MNNTTLEYSTFVYNGHVSLKGLKEFLFKGLKERGEEKINKREEENWK